MSKRTTITEMMQHLLHAGADDWQAVQQARPLVLRLRGRTRPGNAGGRGPGDARDESGDGRTVEPGHGAGALQ